MRINSKDTIAGVPIMTVRDAMKRRHADIYVGPFSERLKEYAGRGQAVLDALVADGRMTVAADSDGDLSYELTTAGHALAGASAAAPIKRARAQKALDEFLVRVEEWNSNPLTTHVVTRVVLFGSFLNESLTEVSDVDLAVQTAMIRQHTDEQHVDYFNRAFLQRRRPRPGDPVGALDLFPYLKGKSPVLGIIELNEAHELFLAGVDRKRTIFTDAP